MTLLDDLKKIINNVKEEISVANELDGLCYYASNNIAFDLDKALINSEIFNIREMADTNYDHFFVLAFLKNNFYLIDTTYFQFVKKEGRNIRFSDNWPGDILKENNEKLLNNLLKEGYS